MRIKKNDRLFAVGAGFALLGLTLILAFGAFGIVQKIEGNVEANRRAERNAQIQKQREEDASKIIRAIPAIRRIQRAWDDFIERMIGY